MTDLVYLILVFVGVGVFFLFFHMMLGKLVRPSRPDSEKLTIYECGEPAVGTLTFSSMFATMSWPCSLSSSTWKWRSSSPGPWSSAPSTKWPGILNGRPRARPTTFRTRKRQSVRPRTPNLKRGCHRSAMRLVANWKTSSSAGVAWSWAWVAFMDILVFFGVLLVGFAYLWRRGDIDWVRSTTSENVGRLQAGGIADSARG